MAWKKSRKSSDGLEAAYGARRVKEMQARKNFTRLLRLLSMRPSGDAPEFIEFFPPVNDAEEFSDLSARVVCYLGDVDLPKYLPGRHFDIDPDAVAYMEPGIVRDPGWVENRPTGRSFLIIHRITPRSLLKMLTFRGAGVSVVDKEVYLSTELFYWSARAKLAWPNYPSADVSLARLKSEFSNARTAFILATGPSSLGVDLEAVETDVRITCNSAVRDKERLAQYRPNVIAFTDPVFHFGPSKYAAEFRRDLIEAVEVHDPILVCGSDWVSPLLNLHPELEPRLVVVPFAQGGRWRWPSRRDPTVRATESVLTNLMLPVAFLLADEVRVAGVDGRQPVENYFWKHGLQYSDDLMKTIFDAHPAFFRDRDYEDYYDVYCDQIEEFIAFAESKGKVVAGAAPSWIPAFQRRGASEPTP